ncbi:MAG TPA: ribosomal protein L7/L12 [Pirellulales bacterium]|jgi:ribosomal protein L7/L12
MPAWEDEIRRLLANDRKIDAIKLYRQKTGLGLKEAKDWIEQLQQTESDTAADPATAGDLDQQLLKLLQADQKIAAIKLYRERKSVGLKQAKDAVEALAAQHGILFPARAGCFGVLVLLLCGLALLVAGLAI